MSRRKLRAGLVVLLLGVATGHVAWHYWPRERAAPADSELAREAFADTGARWTVWVPYPHQNLARFEAWLGGDLRAWLRELGGSDGAASAAPRLGPFLVPPARELVVQVGTDGSVRAAARLYPAIAALARAAGAVARNPWLAGGEVRIGRERRARVKWQGLRWSLEPERAVGAPPPGDAALPLEAVLGLARLGAPTGPLPAGLYRLRRAAGALEIVAGEPPAAPAIPVALLDRGAPAPAGWLAERTPGGGARALAIWSEPSDVAGLPRVAVFDRPPGAGFPLPGEKLLELVGRPAPAVRAGEFAVRGLDRVAAADGAVLAAALAPDFGSGTRDPAAWAVARPDRLAPVARDLAALLAETPFVREEEARPFALAAALLAPLDHCATATLEVGVEPTFVRVRPCAGNVLVRGRSD